MLPAQGAHPLSDLFPPDTPGHLKPSDSSNLHHLSFLSVILGKDGGSSCLLGTQCVPGLCLGGTDLV